MISISDLEWAASRLFNERPLILDKERRDVLMAMHSVDIEACPGSGKTTLVAIKLLCLLKHWKPDAAKGLCVLSHTNVAAQEISQRLLSARTPWSLSDYPHFIGTVHGFMSTFVARPYLRALGAPVRVADNDLVRDWRWRSLKPATRHALEKAGHNSTLMEVKEADYSVGKIKWGKSELSKEIPTYRDIMHVCERSTLGGCLCFDEIFIWAHHMLRAYPGIADSLACRFPIVIVDEAQDNSNIQATALWSVFGDRDDVIVQRFGDPNQAIYSESTISNAYSFPAKGRTLSVSSSHRFDQKIADLADPLALRRRTRLCGLNPRTSGPNTVFVFEEGCEEETVAEFGRLVISTFTQEEIALGQVVALGQRQKRSSTPPAQATLHS